MRSVNEIYEALKADFLEASGRDITEGGDMSLRLMAVAAEIFSLEAQCEFVKRQAFPQTAAGEYLDYHARCRAIERRKAAAATGRLKFLLNENALQDVEIAAGLQCLDRAGNVFVTAEAGSITAGESECEVEAYALKAGVAGNAAAGSIVLMRQAPTGVSAVTNELAFSGGCDEECDSELRTRVLDSYRSLPNGANAAYYRALAMSVPGVEKVLVQPRKRGRGTVDIVFSAVGGVPGQELLDRVGELISEAREICVDVNVSAPETADVDIAAQLSIADGYSFENVKAGCEKALTDYFGGDKLGEGIYMAKLCSIIMGVEGVENCRLTAPVADTEPIEGVLPVIAGLDISQAV